MKKLKLRKTLRVNDIELLIDTREQTPLNLDPFKTSKATLPTGDYTIKGLERRVVVERKTLADMIGCIGRDRKRFEKEVQRLLAYDSRALFIEGSWKDIEQKNYRGEVHPSAAMSSILGWMGRGIPVMFCGSAAEMAMMVKRFMFVVAQRNWREVHELAGGILNSDSSKE